jgi:ABC-type bacteriocin/lantibiotic exporter with double-glycine peptidase domain
MDNCVHTTSRLLASLGIRHTKKYLRDTVLSHPDLPSLLSISDTLEKYQIETLAVKIDLEKLKEMPMPCIVQVEQNRQPLFYVLRAINKDTASYYNDKNKLIEVSKELFMEQWTGICLLAETNEASKEKDIEKKIAAKRFQDLLKGSMVILLLIWTVFGFINSNISHGTTTMLYALAYTLLKSIGLSAGIFLLWFDIDRYNPTLQSFCSGGGTVNARCCLKSHPNVCSHQITDGGYGACRDDSFLDVDGCPN